MRLWIDVYDPTYTTLQGDGPIPVVSAKAGRALDGPARCSAVVPATDARALSLLSSRRIAEVWYSSPTDANGKRLLCAFVIHNISFADDAQRTMQINGDDALSLLITKITYLRDTYSQQSFSTIVNTLENITGAGWDFDITNTLLASKDISTRFDGQTVLKALQTLCEHEGAHFRLKAGEVRTVEIGFFGAQTSVRVEAYEGAPHTISNNAELSLLKRISITEKSQDIVNAILPTGASNGEFYIDLEESTRGRKVTTIRNGVTEYWLEDAPSIATYGRIERRMTFREIAPVTNSAADRLAASNVLDDAAYAELNWRSLPQTIYRLEAKKVDTTISVGDRLPVAYRGTVLQDGTVTATRTIDGTFWVLSADENVGDDGQTVALEVSNIDRQSTGVASVVLGTVDAIEVNGVNVQPEASKCIFGPYYEDIDSSTSATVPIDLTSSTLRIVRVYLRFTTSPFRSNVVGAASGGGSTQTSESGGGSTQTSVAGGDHHHILAAEVIGAPPPLSTRYWVLKDSTGTDNVAEIRTSNSDTLRTAQSSGNHAHDINIPAHTHDTDIPSHTHAQQYGIYNDTIYPEGVTIRINGVDQTVPLGGPWFGSNVDVEVEISQYFNDQPTLQKRHTIEFLCAWSQGRVRASVEVNEMITSIANL